MNCVFLTTLHKGNCFPAKRSTKQSRHFAQVPNSVSVITVDTWEESTDTWRRVHLKPRRVLFTPAHVDHGPRPGDLENDRETHTSFVDETESTSVLRDKWSGPKSRRSLGQHRTGKTVFRKRMKSIPSTSSQPPDMEGGFSVSVSFDLNSRKDAMAFVMNGAQAARKGARMSVQNI